MQSSVKEDDRVRINVLYQTGVRLDSRLQRRVTAPRFFLLDIFIICDLSETEGTLTRIVVNVTTYE